MLKGRGALVRVDPLPPLLVARGRNSGVKRVQSARCLTEVGELLQQVSPREPADASPVAGDFEFTPSLARPGADTVSMIVARERIACHR
jgi:hypothetical protein